MEQSQGPHCNLKKSYIAGVDEVGRGPLAGPVIAAVVILHPKYKIEGLDDSKKLTPEKREFLAEQILNTALDYAWGRADVFEIDKINIFHASLLAMKRAIEKLKIKPKQVLIDGTHSPKISYPSRAIIRGDETEPVISAASIIAKVARDREMIQFDQQYPGYGFAKNKGYYTEEHVSALVRLGPCEIHRQSFEPVKSLILHQ